VRKLLAAILLAAGLAAPAGAICTFTGGVLPLEIPTLGDSGATWAACLQRNFEKISVGGGGHFIEKDGAPIVQRATMNFIGDGVTVTDVAGKTQVEVLAVPGDVLRSTAVYIGQVTTSDTGWATVAGSTGSVYSELSTFLEADFNCNLECVSYTACGANFGLIIDGDYVDDETSDPDTGFQYVKTDGSNLASPEPLAFKYRTKTKVDVGTHTIAILWASPDGGDLRMGRNVSNCFVKYSNDLDTINSGSAANRAGISDFGAQSTAGLIGLTCNTLPCQAQSIDDNDIYTATGTAPGQWRNSRTGTGPE